MGPLVRPSVRQCRCIACQRPPGPRKGCERPDSLCYWTHLATTGSDEGRLRAHQEHPTLDDLRRRRPDLPGRRGAQGLDRMDRYSACARAPESCLSSSRSASRPLTWGAHGLDLAVGACTDRESVMITLHMNPKTLIYWYTERQRIVTSEVKDVEIQGRVPLGATQSLRIESGRVPLWQLVVCENFVDHSFSEAAPAARPADSDEPPLGGDGIFDWTSGGPGPRKGE